VTDITGNVRDVYSLPGSVLKINNIALTEMEAPFPNPAKTSINIPYSLTTDSGDIIIYNSQGQIIEQLKIDKNFENVNLDITSYTNGVYFYHISSEDFNSTTKKFIKQ
jgi:hypothetical protein